MVWGEMEGVTTRGRPRQEWLDEIQELKRKAQDRETLGHTLVKRALDTNG